MPAEWIADHLDLSRPLSEWRPTPNQFQMNAREKAQAGRDLMKEAVLDLIHASGRALTHSDIVNELDIPSDFAGVGKNYLSWSIVGLLVNEEKIRYQGDRHKRVYYVRKDQLDTNNGKA